MGQDQDPQDTEGHKHLPYPATPDDDTEGHKHLPYPATPDDPRATHLPSDGTTR